MAEIELEHVCKTYENGFEAVKDFNLKIADKEFIIFVGPSGCGKSTTLRMIAGLEDISGGELYIDGVKMNDVSASDRDIAMVFQNYALYPHMSVRKNIAYSLKIRGEKKDVIEQKVQEAAEILGLKEVLDRKPGQLSGGQKQRVTIGAAIVKDSPVIYFDEPTSGLDYDSMVRVSHLIEQLAAAGVIIFVVSHDFEFITRTCSEVLQLDGQDSIKNQVLTPEILLSLSKQYFN